MTKTPDFADFLRRIRAGDDAAALELVQRYEPLIRREVRMRIGDDRLNRAFDSLDVSQSVFAQFFSRASTGEYQFDRPEQLARLLVTMARNRLITRIRRERRLVRDVRRLAVEQCLLDQVADTRPSPSEILLRKEAMELLKRALTDEEYQIFELRRAGLGWDEVASRVGGNGHARRMQLSRGLDRLAKCAGTAAESAPAPCDSAAKRDRIGKE
jgi:RNA polymerase sigma factor (sigma-70 family)